MRKVEEDEEEKGEEEEEEVSGSIGSWRNNWGVCRNP